MKTIGKFCLGAAAGLVLAGCSQGFSAAERETIRSGGEGIMRGLTVDDRSDSLVLRRKSAPMVEGMERADDYETLRRRIDYSRRRRAEGKRSAKLRFLRVFSILTACIQ